MKTRADEILEQICVLDYMYQKIVSPEKLADFLAKLEQNSKDNPVEVWTGNPGDIAGTTH